jgi:hypothetical protein
MEQLRCRGDPEGMLEVQSEYATPLVIPVPRLEQDLKALFEVTEPIVPPSHLIELSDHSTSSKCAMVLGMQVEKAL